MFIPSDQPDEHRPPVRSLHQRSDKLLAGCGFRCRRLFRRLRSDDKVRGSTPQQTLFLFRGDNSFPQPGSSTRHSGKESKREGISFLEIAEHYDITGYSISRALAFLSIRLFHRPFVLYSTRPYSRPYDGLVRSVLQCYYGDDELETDPYLSSVLAFYSHFPSKRKIYLPPEVLDKCKTWYTGKDARLFHAAMRRGALDLLYDRLLREARLGFGNIVVSDEHHQELLHAALKFLNLRATISLTE